MDLNSKFQKANPIGLNDRFTDSGFEPLAPKPIAPIQTGAYEGIKALWNPVGQTVRDVGMEKFGKLLQPDTVIHEGKRVSTENKTFNELSKDELNSKLTELTATSKKDADGVLYKLRNPTTGEVKYGKAGDSVWKRYGTDAGMQDNWIVEYQRPMKNTSYAERLIHGNESALRETSLPFGQSSYSSLQAGGTEIYKQDPLAKDSMSKVNKLLTPEQDSYASKVLDGIKIRTGLADIDTKGKTQRQESVLDIVKNVNKARLEATADTILGANVGLQKLTGGLNSLMGFNAGKELAQRNATQTQKTMVDKDSLSAMAGEIAPELFIPAVGQISRGANIAKRIAQGAGSGALITGGYEAVKQQSGIKEGMPTDIKMATGLGGVIGGVVGGLTKNPALGKTIGEAFVAGDNKAKEAIMETYPEIRGALETYAKERQLAKKQEEKTVTQSDTVKPLPKQETIKPQPEIVKTKRHGLEIKSKEVIEGKKKIEDIEYNIVEPKASEGLPLKEQTYVPTVNNPKKFSYGYDSRGRVYTEEANMLSPQGGATQKATLEQRTKPEIENTHEEVSRRLEFYDRDSALRKTYGQTQASYKEGKELSKSQELANRLEFEKQQYADMMKDKSLDRDLRNEARTKLSELNKTEIKDYIATQSEIESAEKKYQEQFKVETKDIPSQQMRERKISQEYKDFKLAKEKSSKEGYQTTATKTPAEVTRKLVTNAMEIMKDAKKAIAEVSKKERLAGRDFDATKISEQHRKLYRDEIGKIEDVQNARADLKDFKDNKIDINEFQFREKRRIDQQLEREGKTKFKSLEEANTYKESVKQRYEDIGVHVSDSEIKVDLPKERTGKKETPEKKEIRESEEIKQSEQKHKTKVSQLSRYKKGSKESPKYKTGEKAGQDILSKSEMDEIDRGVLSLKEIADKSSPIGKAEDIKDLRIQAQESANLKTTKAEQKKLGIKWEVNPKQIQFKDTLQDASNSVAQISTVLLGSKNLAKYAKTAGKENIGDIRSIIADAMSKLLPKDFPIEFNKDSVKPIFMTENYGQGQKGLIRNIMKEHKVSKEEATQFLDAYNKSFDNIAPEMVKLRERIMETFKSGNGEVSYTLPDGFKVEFKVKQKLDGSYSIKGKNNPIKIETDDIDDMSSAILPNIIHSVDAYVAREMNKLGIATVHDAFQTPKGWTDEMVQKAYGDVMAKVNESNILDDILKSLGDTKPSLKIGDLESSAIKESAMEKESLAPEEIKGEVHEAKVREIDVSTSKTSDEVMKEFMAKDNVRETNANSLVKEMTAEAGYRTMSVAKEGDDVFERQVALAHQSENYNPRMEIKVPNGVNQKVWDKVQREIFNEARAKLEFNPLLNNVIKGDRKFFNESGKLIGKETKTFQELLVEEKRLGRKQLRRLNREERNAVKQIAPNYDRLQQVVKNWHQAKQLNNAESIAKNLVHEARQPEIPRSVFKKNIDKVKAYFKDQVSDSKESRDFMKLFSFKGFTEADVAKRAEDLKKDLSKRFKGQDRKELNDAILKTDYNAIREMKSPEQAESFMKEHDNIYKLAKEYIDQGAKAIGEASEQIGFFRNNAKAIADELNMPSSVVPIIDKMISIKAMTPKAWKKINELRDTEDFKYVMDIISANKERSAKEFHTNPHQQVKGFMSEVYNESKKIEGDKVLYDADTKFEGGAIPATLERKKVGSYQEEFPIGDFKSLREKSEFAKENKLKITENGGFRKIAEAQLKDKAGRSNNFDEILTATTSSIDAKEMQKLISKNIIDEIVSGSSMFSKEPKEGFRKITEQEANRMPKIVGDSLAGRYINEAYDKRLLGRNEVRLYNGENQVGKIADRLLKNSVLHFKQNVILKNPKSYLNATMVNQLIASTAGVNPAKLLKYQAEAIKEIKTTDKLREQISLLKAQGKNTEHLQKELEKSTLYQMEKNGLAINKLEVAGDDSTLMGQILSDMTKGKLDKATHELYLSQEGTIGKEAFKLFGKIDTQGRYTLAKHFMDNGMNIADATRKANGLFGDMNQMSPAIIEALDRYGFIPFLKWASLTTPMLMKLAKDNPAKAMAIGIAMYGMQVETNKDFSTVNPLEAIVNFGDDATSLEYLEQSEKEGFGEATKHKIKTYFVPKVYREFESELTMPQHNFFLKEQMEKPSADKIDYRPLTQRIVKD